MVSMIYNEVLVVDEEIFLVWCSIQIVVLIEKVWCVVVEFEYVFCWFG